MAPEEHRAWLESLTLERPMPDDDTTLKLRAVLQDDDLAEVVWALTGDGALRWLDSKLTSLGGRRPREFLDSDQGKQVLWNLLQAASAWL
jgi:hypothetical protein